MADSTMNTRDSTLEGDRAPWLASAPFDLFLIIAPAFISSLVVILFADRLSDYDYLPLWAWIAFVLLVDVAHVYSTLFRTYLDSDAFQRNKGLLITIPLLCWMVGSLLYSLGALAFWRALAYLAVFHFIRQQFGFVSLYARHEPSEFQPFKRLDGLAIYSATIYPLLYWHCHMPRNFNWFIKGDFFVLDSFSTLTEFGLWLYLLIIGAYFAKEIYLIKKTGYFNLPKNLMVAGTALSWWIGIVFLDSDLAFTMTNVLSHGIPYMALIWLYHHKPKESSVSSGIGRGVTMTRNFIMAYLPAFLLFLFLLAYLEEGIWDGLIWREHGQIFAFFYKFPEITDPTFLAVLIPFLALPQSVHYVLDGFIWRIKDRGSIWTA